MVVHVVGAKIIGVVVGVGVVAGETAEVGGFVGTDGFEGNDFQNCFIGINIGIEIFNCLRPVSGSPGTVRAGGVGRMFDFFADFNHVAAVTLENQDIGKGFEEVVEKRTLDFCHGERQIKGEIKIKKNKDIRK